MLAAQMQKSADKAMAAVSVVITAARPVAVVLRVVFRFARDSPLEGSGFSVPLGHLPNEAFYIAGSRSGMDVGVLSG
jgi:hypothetical protein